MNETKAPLKQRIVAEAIEYSILVVYLACFFGAFTWYRRLILGPYHISYEHYGVAVIKAVVLGKVILIAEALHVGQRFEDKPLIVPTLYKTVVFTLCVAVFDLLEATLRGLLRGEGLAAGLDELMGGGRYEFLALCLIAFLAFIPLFGFRELEQALGIGRLRTRFFRARSEWLDSSRPEERLEAGVLDEKSR